MRELVWMVVSMCVAIGAAIIISGIMDRKIKRQIKTKTPKDTPTLDMSKQGMERILAMDARRLMPVGTDQVEYSACRAFREYSKTQKLEKEGIEQA